MHTLHMHPQSKYQKPLAVKWWGSSKHKWKSTPTFWPTRQQHNNPFWNNLIKWHPKQPYCTTKCLYFFVKNELVLYITILLLNTQDIVHHCIKISGNKKQPDYKPFYGTGYFILHISHGNVETTTKKRSQAVAPATVTTQPCLKAPADRSGPMATAHYHHCYTSWYRWSYHVQ